MELFPGLPTLSRPRLAHSFNFYSTMPVTQRKPRSTTLSQLDLRTISQAISRDFAPRFFRARAEEQRQSQFSAQELREIGRQISRDFSHTLEIVPPKLVLLPVSPGHLHAYWQLDKPALPASIAGNTQPAEAAATAAVQLTLRVYAEQASAVQAPKASEPEQATGTDIAVVAEQGHAEIFLPPASSEPSQAEIFRATLGLIQDGQAFQPLLRSNSAEPAALPRQHQQSAASPALLQSIMSSSHPGSSADKTRSGQGK